MPQDGKPGKQRTDSELSRRRVLALTGAAGAVSLAGCSGELGEGGETTTTTSDGGGETTEGGGNETATTSGSSEELVDATWYTRTTKVPTDIRFNQYAQANTDWYTSSLIHGFGAKLTRREPLTWVPVLAKDWSLDGKTFTVNLNENFTWHDGESVTAEDYVFQYEISEAMGAGKHAAPLDYLEGLPSATGEYSMEMTLKEQLNPSVFIPQNFSEPIWYTPKQYRPHLEKIRDASGEDAKKTARSDLTKATFEKPIGFGPLKFVARDKQKMELEVFEDYPFEDVQKQFSESTGIDVTDWGRPNFSKVVAKHVPSHNKMSQELMSKSIDGGVTPYISPDQLPEGHRVVQYPILHGSGLMFNFYSSGAHPGWDIWTKVHVRKALAHAIDRKAAGIQLGSGVPSTPTDSLMTGMLSAQENEWLSDSFKGSLQSYDHDYAKAEEHLRKAGCTKEDGKWYKPNGERFEALLKTGACVTHYVNFFEVVSSNLSELGLKVTVQNEACSTFFSKADNDSGMQLSTAYWGGGNKHPYFAFDWMYRRNYVTEEGSKEKDYYLPGDEILEVPPVGKPDSSKRVKMDPKKKIRELGVTTDEARQKELVKELTWATNWSVPKITCNENTIGGALSNDEWKLPAFDSPMTAINPNFNTIFQFGFVDAKSN